MVTHVFDDLHLGGDLIKRGKRLVLSAHQTQNHVDPVPGRDQIVVVATKTVPATKRLQRTGPVLLQIVGQTQVIPHVTLSGRQRDILRIRQTIRLNRYGRSIHQDRRPLQIGNGMIELADG